MSYDSGRTFTILKLLYDKGHIPDVNGKSMVVSHSSSNSLGLTILSGKTDPDVSMFDVLRIVCTVHEK